jgi:thiamine-phosphate pyrophosphorylase
VDVIQLRSKKLSDRPLYELGREIKELAEKHKKLFIVDDRVDLAKAVDADGVHLGQEDLPIREARKIWGKSGKIIGYSTHSLEQALRAEREGADYIGVGPIFSTPTKPDYPAVGLKLIQKVKRRISIPFVAIGGIDESNVREVLAQGATRVACVRAIFGYDNTYSAAKRLKNLIENEHDALSLL